MTKKGKLTFVFVTLLLIVALAGSVMAASADALKYDGKYYSDFEDHDEVVAAAAELNIQIAGEGMVLLKNDNETLPFASDVKNVSVFGVRSDNLRLPVPARAASARTPLPAWKTRSTRRDSGSTPR